MVRLGHSQSTFQIYLPSELQGITGVCVMCCKNDIVCCCLSVSVCVCVLKPLFCVLYMPRYVSGRLAV